MKKGWAPVALVVTVAVGLSLWFGLRSTTPTTTTTATSTTVSAAAIQSVWPTPFSGVTYATPSTAARGFATEFLGMKSPVVGVFRQGDSRSGEVDIQSTSRGPTTTALVRQLGTDSSWSVIGATTPDVVITSPATLSVVASPVALRGRSTAFEGVVNVSLRDDVSATPLAATTMMGGSNGVMGPFGANLMFATPRSGYGDLTLYLRSAKDGSLMCASVIRVRF
ncbi:MAG: Gmad2 immunoglobulin-like domain-containing protein [Acidimicrobiales bacterium]